MLIFTIVVTILLVSTLLFIGWIFLYNYLNPTIAPGHILAEYKPKEGYIVYICSKDIGKRILRLETQIEHEYEDEYGECWSTVVYGHANFLCWFLPMKSKLWKVKLTTHYENKLNRLKAQAERWLDRHLQEESHDKTR